MCVQDKTKFVILSNRALGFFEAGPNSCLAKDKYLLFSKTILIQNFDKGSVYDPNVLKMCI